MNVKITKTNEAITRFNTRVELLEYAQLCKLRETYLGSRGSETYQNFVKRMNVKEQEILALVNALMKFYGYRNKAVAIQWFKTTGCKILYKDQAKARGNWLAQNLEGRASEAQGGR